MNDEQCWSCCFYVAREGGERGNGKFLEGICRRYPVEAKTTDYSWCGEYKRWKNNRKLREESRIEGRNAP